MYLRDFLLIMAGVFGAVLGLCALVLLVERKFPTDEYDERQKIAQGNAYRLCFWVNVILGMGLMIWQISQVESGKSGAELYVLLFAQLILSLMVFHTYCAFTVASTANARTASPILNAVCYGFMSFVNFSFFFRRWEAGSVLPELSGRESATWLQLLSGVCFAYLCLVTAIQTVVLRLQRSRE